MIRNNIFWSHIIRAAFIPQIEAFGACLNTRVIPSFRSLGEDAKEVEDDAYEQMSRYASENSDPGSIAEAAFNRGLDFYQTMMDMSQGIHNLFAVGLYHIFEQQLLFFHRRELLKFGEEGDPTLFRSKVALKRLAMHGIVVKQFRSWRKVEELRELTNTIKHADGRACEELKKLRPDLFSRPGAEDFGTPYLPGLKVFQPLTGESIYVTDDVFNEFNEAVKSFWSELAEVLERPER